MTDGISKRVSTVSNSDGSPVLCVFGGHELEPARVEVGGDIIGVHTEVDGFPVCVEHVLLVANKSALSGITEGRIKKALLRNDEVGQRARAQALLRRSENSAQPGWIYYLRVGELIKIGYTSNLETRMAAYPPNSTILAAHPGTRRLEQDMHRRFAELRARGREWFHSGAVIHRHIEDVLSRFGVPEAIVKPMRHAKHT